jgi:hypothetical protein
MVHQVFHKVSGTGTGLYGIEFPIGVKIVSDLVVIKYADMGIFSGTF